MAEPAPGRSEQLPLGSWGTVPRVLCQSTRHQHPPRARPAKHFSGPEPSPQVEGPALLPGAHLPNQETKAFVGPGLQVATRRSLQGWGGRGGWGQLGCSCGHSQGHSRVTGRPSAWYHGLGFVPREQEPPKLTSPTAGTYVHSTFGQVTVLCSPRLSLLRGLSPGLRGSAPRTPPDSPLASFFRALGLTSEGHPSRESWVSPSTCMQSKAARCPWWGGGGGRERGEQR